MSDISRRLEGIRIAVPESRQLDTLVQLFERRGAQVIRAPLVAIHAAPDSGSVLDWIRRFISSPPDLFIILTGEGVRRLLALAEQHGVREAFVKALAKTTLLCRGPKPDRALREVGVKGGIKAHAPTTDGVIESLNTMPIEGQQIAVQLYGDDPNVKLMSYLAVRQAVADSVAPYVYADELEESGVIDLIQAISASEVDVITFTSQPQYRRLVQVAGRHKMLDVLKTGLNACCVAAVGPVVKEQLEADGITVDIMPGQAFFMKPLVTEIMRYFSNKAVD